MLDSVISLTKKILNTYTFKNIEEYMCGHVGPPKMDR